VLCSTRPWNIAARLRTQEGTVTSFRCVRTLSSTLALSCLILGGPVSAQSSPPRPELRAERTPASTLEGELVSVDPLTRIIVIKTATGRKERLRYTEMTLVKGATPRVAGLTASEPLKVTVRYAGDPRDRVASEITVHGKNGQ
jgi:hypothetical protein